MDARQREEVSFKNILLSCVSCVVLTGCYTQLSMFYPEPEIEEDIEDQFYETYSRAVPRPTNISIYAQDGAGTPLSMAYQMMYNRFYGRFHNWGNYYSDGYYNPYYSYNSYGQQWGYDSYYIGGYKMYIPVNTGERKQRTFSTSRDSDGSPETNLNVTRTKTNTTNRVSDPYPVQDTPRQDTFNSQRPSSNDSGGRRATRRN